LPFRRKAVTIRLRPRSTVSGAVLVEDDEGLISPNVAEFEAEADAVVRA
jgi:hypothetical protein